MKSCKYSQKKKDKKIINKTLKTKDSFKEILWNKGK